MKYGFKRKLDISGYSKNASKNFSLTKIIIYTVLSIILSTSLLISIIKNNYQGKALLFSGLALILIVGYTFLNIKALIIKIKDSK